MTDGTTPNGGGQDRNVTDGATRSTSSIRRRSFLKATGAGAIAAGAGLTGIGSAAGQGIPTPWLSRDGNLVTDPSGNEVILRGVNMVDPRRANATAPARGKTAEQIVDFATDAEAGWHSRVVRVPVQPGDVAGLTPVPNASGVQVYDPVAFTREELVTYCEEHLDPVVDRCEERGTYCIVDYHRHWGGAQQPWDDPTLAEEVQLFWEVVAPRYADRSHVIYEVYNEPTSPQMGETPIDNQWSAGIWRDWKSVAQPWVDTIRESADNLVIIGSPSWSQYPDGALVEEFDGSDLGYTYHIYPGHSISSQDQWDVHDGDNGEGVRYCYEEVPLFVTEFGWGPNSSYPTNGTTSAFGDDFLAWMADKPIHWTAWCFDPVWQSPMFERAFQTDDSVDAIGKPYSNEMPEFCSEPPCDWAALGGENMGVRIKEELAALRNQDVPGGGTSTTEGTEQSTTTTERSTTEEQTTEVQTSEAESTEEQAGTPGRVGGNDGLPGDPDSDGLYEDVNGNDRQDIADAVDLFQNRDSVEPTFFDFNDSGEMEIGDAVELFRENTG